jgi:hypothetical protein
MATREGPKKAAVMIVVITSVSGFGSATSSGRYKVQQSSGLDPDPDDSLQRIEGAHMRRSDRDRALRRCSLRRSRRRWRPPGRWEFPSANARVTRSHGQSQEADCAAATRRRRLGASGESESNEWLVFALVHVDGRHYSRSSLPGNLFGSIFTVHLSRS